MNIDRHNYEECFILYWDNELTASQKQAVEKFVKENADLQEEFNILGETRFTPDNNVRFEEKGFLVNHSFINITNYEEQLLDYIDDELNDTERKEVEKFAATNSNIKKELALLQKTKLQPEAIVFPDKSVLYRREEKVRIISMTWLRVAVAAAIILIAGFATIRFINTNKGGSKNEIAGGSQKNTTTPSINDSSVRRIDPQQAGREKDPNTARSSKGNKGQYPANESKLTNDVVATIDDIKNKNDLPIEGSGIAPSTTDPGATSDVAPGIINLPPKEVHSRVQTYALEKINDVIDKSFVTNTSRITSDDIDVPEEEGPSKEKGGLKQFLRKTTRVFERRTNIQTTTEDNKLLLGAFAVSLK